MITEQTTNSNRAYPVELAYQEMFYDGFSCRSTYRFYSDGAERVHVVTKSRYGDLHDQEMRIADYVILFGLGLDELAAIKLATRKQVAA